MKPVDTHLISAASRLSVDAAQPGAAVHSEREPYEALDDLMSVIEALCPTWPERPVFPATAKFLL